MKKLLLSLPRAIRYRWWEELAIGHPNCAGLLAFLVVSAIVLALWQVAISMGLPGGFGLLIPLLGLEMAGMLGIARRVHILDKRHRQRQENRRCAWM